jgi:hypothetical protein
MITRGYHMTIGAFSSATGRLYRRYMSAASRVSTGCQVVISVIKVFAQFVATYCQPSGFRFRVVKKSVIGDRPGSGVTLLARRVSEGEMGTNLAITFNGITRTRRHSVPSFVLSHGCQWIVNLRDFLADASGYLFVDPQRVPCGRDRLRGVRIDARCGLESAGLALGPSFIFSPGDFSP